MIIRRFAAENFRNIKKCDIELSDGVNVLLGDNAQGKTNAVEGIYLFARGRSFRTSSDADLIKFGETGFRLSLEYSDKTGKQSLEYAYVDGKRLRKKNGYKVTRVSEMIGGFRAVIFYPDNLGLIKGGPEERRAFLDVAIAQCHPEYLGYYGYWRRAQTERNCLLKFMQSGMPVDRRELDSWSASLAEYSSFIQMYRREYVERLSAPAADFMADISSGHENMTLTYSSDIREEFETREAVRDEYYRIFRSDTEHEAAAGTTLCGIGRDDLIVSVDGVRMRSFSSQGQQRSAVLSLKLAEGEVCRMISGEYPVFLFDDVLSELDSARRDFVMRRTAGKQVIITSCSGVCGLPADARVIRTHGGEFTE